MRLNSILSQIQRCTCRPPLATLPGVLLLATLSIDDVFRYGNLAIGSCHKATANSLFASHFQLACDRLELIGSASFGIRGRLDH